MRYRAVAATFAGLALLATTAALPIGGARAAEVVDEVAATAEAVQGRVMLPVRFDIDPVAKTLETVALPGLEQGLDAAGEVVSTVEAPFELTTAPVASPAGDLPPECSPSTTSSSNFTAYPPRYAAREKKDAYFLQYQFQANQRDYARILNDQDTRQFMECVAGGGRTFTNHEQTVNGGGSTMEDANTSLLINGSKWGTGSDGKGVKATLGFQVSKDPVSVTGSIDGLLGTSGYAGSQGPDKNAYALNDYARNQVNGYWKAGLGGATEAYKGNVSLALWEYSMSDTVNRLTTIRNQAWMVYQCGSPWRFLNKCTTLGVAPAFDGPEVTPQTQTTNSAGSARWDVLVPQDPQNTTTLAFDYGDGTPESRVTIPTGGGASTFTFSHTFSATGTYTQRATVLQTGAFGEARTTNLGTNATGSGYHEGTMTLTNYSVSFPPPCAHSKLEYAGDGTGVVTSGGVGYGPGPVRVTYRVPNVYHNPTGTYTDSTCTVPKTDGWAVDDAHLTGSYVDMFGTTFSVSCAWTTGTYRRGATDHVVTFGPQATTDCTVTVTKADGTTWSHSSRTLVVNEGSSTTCDQMGPPSNCHNGYTFAASDA